jgi:hypothetical protein
LLALERITDCADLKGDIAATYFPQFVVARFFPIPLDKLFRLFRLCRPSVNYSTASANAVDRSLYGGKPYRLCRK